MQRIGGTAHKLARGLGAALPPVLAFSAAVALIGDAAFAPRSWSIAIAGVGPFGSIRIGLERFEAMLLVPLFFVAAAVFLAAQSHRRSRLAVLVIALALVGAGQDVYTVGFGAFTATWLAIGCAGAEPLVLAAIPPVLLRFFLTLHSRVSGGFDVSLLVFGGLIAPLGAAVAGNAPDLARLSRAVVLGLSGIALGALGLGATKVAVDAAILVALIGPALTLIADRLREEIGTDAFDWLGGLARGMPDLSIVLLLLLLAASGLPPGPGFTILAALWRNIVANAGDPVGLAFGIGITAWFALSVFAAIRAFAAISLGRPRSLRAAAAEDARDPALLGVAFLAGAALLFGWFATPERWWLLALAAALAGMVLVLRRAGSRGGSEPVAHWTEGFARPPAWMPFDDPKTEITATGFARPLFGSELTPPALWRRLRAAVLTAVAS